MNADDPIYDAVGAYVVPQLLYVAAKLRIADLLAGGPLDAAALAERSGAHEPSLARALRALASLGIFARGRDGRYRLTPSAQPLRSDHPRSRRSAIQFAGEEQQQAWGAVLHSMKTGRSAFDHVYGHPFAEHLAGEEEALDAAQDFRARREARRNGAIAAALDISRARSIVDVGGGTGELLAELLSRHPGLTGTLLDVPAVAERARARIEALGLSSRCDVVGGDARARVPAGRDAYVLAEVLHCFDDPEATKILRRCRGRVYAIERVLPPTGRASADFFADLHMLVLHGGRERTRREFAALFDAAGLCLRHVRPTDSWVSILEAPPIRA